MTGAKSSYCVIRPTEDEIAPVSDRPLSLANPFVLRTFVTNIAEGIYITAPGGDLLDANVAAIEMFGARSLEQLREVGIDDLIVDSRERARQRRLVEEQGFVRDFQIEIRRLDGERRVLRDTVLGLRDDDGRVVAHLGVLTDVTNRVRAEEENIRLSAFPRENPNPILVCDAGGTIVYANEATERAMRLLGAEAPLDLLPADYLDIVRSCLRDKQPRRDLEFEAGDRVFHWSYLPVRSGLVHLYGVDVTERRALEIQLLQTHKLETLGRLASGVAHDFNNILTGIQGYAQLALANVEEHSPVGADVAKVLELSQRSSRLIGQLLAFSRQQSLQRRAVDLNALIDDTAELLRPLIGANVRLRVIAGGALRKVEADPDQIDQILMNLAVNARDAMPDGGTLTIETANVTVDEGCEGDCWGVTPGPYVQITVTDTGCGMDRATRRQIFEPFFTTKEGDKGTGLGLSTVYGIIKQHNGSIRVDSTPGEGTVFELILPCVSADEVLNG